MPKLPNTAWAVLGLLSMPGERSGYDLKKWADASLRYLYWSPALSQIYTELKRLEQLGFAVSCASRPRTNSATSASTRSPTTGRAASNAGCAKARAARRSSSTVSCCASGWGSCPSPRNCARPLRSTGHWADRTLAEVHSSEEASQDPGRSPAPRCAGRSATTRAERDLAEGMLADLDELYEHGEEPPPTARAAGGSAPAAPPSAAGDGPEIERRRALGPRRAHISKYAGTRRSDLVAEHRLGQRPRVVLEQAPSARARAEDGPAAVRQRAERAPVVPPAGRSCGR
ncbi:PadR family transcriptional regulator [Yinghuangia aomiensis]